MKERYFLGLDMGIASLGFACVDEDFKVISKKGQKLWGVRLFDSAQTAEERRLKRSARRRLGRRRLRIKELESIFHAELSKLDEGFLQRLKNSYKLEDEAFKSSLFASKKEERNFYHNFPTIYHLRAHLMENEEKDLRLLYLGVLHILKNRGHFTLKAYSFDELFSFSKLLEDLKELLATNYDIELDFEYKDELLSILKEKKDKTTKKKYIKNCFFKEVKLKKLDKEKLKLINDILIPLLAGSKLKLGKVLQLLKDEQSLDELEFCFGREYKEEELKAALEGDYELINAIKNVYDFCILDELLRGEKSISKAKIKAYELYKEELLKLKYIIKTYSFDKYEEAFKATYTTKDSYTAYTGKLYKDKNKDSENNKIFINLKNPKKPEKKEDKDHNFTKASLADMNKYFLGILKEILPDLKDAKTRAEEIGINKNDFKKINEDEAKREQNILKLGFSKDLLELIYPNEQSLEEEEKKLAKSLNIKLEDIALIKELKQKCEQNMLLRKLKSFENAAIPYQLHAYELEQILKKQNFAFLKNITGTKLENPNSLDMRAKILALHSFCIPYYAGPLNDSLKDKQDYNIWIVKKESFKNTPVNAYNFDVAVDKGASAKAFIKRMRVACSYLAFEKTLPKKGLIYSKYELLQELNNIKIAGLKLDNYKGLKERLVRELFLAKDKISFAKLQGFLAKNCLDFKGMKAKDIAISGLAKEGFESSLKSYRVIAKILANIDIKDESKAREIASFYEALDTSIKDSLEDIIEACALLKAQKELLKAEIKEIINKNIKFKALLRDKQVFVIKQLAKQDFSSYASFSKKFLCEIKASLVDENTGLVSEEASILEHLEQSNLNLMQIISKEEFKEKIAKENEEKIKKYENINPSLLKDLYLSPVIKKSLYQALLLVEELIKIKGYAPAKIFIESTRELGKKGKIPLTRKAILLNTCKKFEKDIRGFKNADFKKDALYLYFLQDAKCMYTGESLNLNELDKYQVDHIYPQSVIKDNSLDNKVLIKSEANQIKKNIYPLDENIQKKMQATWFSLKKAGKLSAKKYDRLCSKDVFDLQAFLARDLLVTASSIKAFKDILENALKQSFFKGVKPKLIPVKSAYVSEYRRILKAKKLRELNRYHHGYDAYLSIVVGNILYARFGKKPSYFIKDELAKKLKNKDKDSINSLASIIGKNPLRPFVIKDKERIIYDEKRAEYVNDLFRKRADMLISTKAEEKTGELFKASVYRKGLAKIALKKNKEIDKYGGYKGVNIAYYIYASYILKGKKEQGFIPIPIFVKKGKEALAKYLNEQGYKELKMLVPLIKIPFKLLVDGVPYLITGRSENKLLRRHDLDFDMRDDPSLQSYLALFLRALNIAKKEGSGLKEAKDKKRAGLAALELFCENTRKGRVLKSYQYINKEENLRLYEYFQKKLENSVYKRVFPKEAKRLEEKKASFKELDIFDELEILSEILKFFYPNRATSNLSLLYDGKKNENLGGLSLKMESEKNESLVLVYESISGFYKKSLSLKDRK